MKFLNGVVLGLLLTTVAQNAKADFWWGPEAKPGHRIENGVAVWEYYPVSCAYDAPIGSPDWQERTEYIREKDDQTIEALQFLNASIQLTEDGKIEFGVSVIMLRCDKGGNEPGTNFHWQAFLPQDSEALVVSAEPSLKFFQTFNAYAPEVGAGKGRRAQMSLDILSNLRNRQLKALDKGEEVEFGFNVYHGYTKATNDFYDRNESYKLLGTGYSTWRPHVTYVITIKKDPSSGHLVLVKKVGVRHRG